MTYERCFCCRYVGVGESNEDQLFYYFVESEGNPKEDPLVVWMSGGPGCSSLIALSMKNIGKRLPHHFIELL